MATKVYTWTPAEAAPGPCPAFDRHPRARYLSLTKDRHSHVKGPPSALAPRPHLAQDDRRRQNRTTTTTNDDDDDDNDSQDDRGRETHNRLDSHNDDDQRIVDEHNLIYSPHLTLHPSSRGPQSHLLSSLLDSTQRKLAISPVAPSRAPLCNATSAPPPFRPPRSCSPL